MLEQDLASIYSFVHQYSGKPAPYYYNVPESFTVPAVYFPRPEILTSGDTFFTYAADCALYIVFFGKTREDAYDLAFAAMTALAERRCVVPRLDEDGNKVKHGIRTKDPAIKLLDNGACQLQIEWTSRKPFYFEPKTKMQHYTLVDWHHPDVYITHKVEAAYEAAVAQVTATDYDTPPEDTGTKP